MSIQRNPVTGKLVAKKFSMRKLMAASENYGGFCRACGEEHEQIEPDARGYRCEACGCNAVYGAEELMMMSGGF